MKKLLIMSFLVCFFTTVALTAVKKDPLTYHIDNDTILFTFTPQLLTTKVKVTSVMLLGSFNQWQKNQAWLLTKKGNTWSLNKQLSEIRVPGNSGQPEYQFVVNDTIWVKAKPTYPDGYKFQNNFLVLFNGDDPIELTKKAKMADTIATECSDEYLLSNFRNVKTGAIGENKLYRSYHPFIASKKEQPLERQRIATVDKFIEESHIASVINLSDEPKSLTLKSVPEYYKNIANKGNILFSTTSYATVFYKSDSLEFAATIKDIFTFISEKEPPFLVHCRLGTDRTGVITAVIEAFMGAKWDAIVNDYQRSNLTGFGEYRDEKLLKYSFEKMLGITVTSETNLKEPMDQYLINKVGISEEILQKVYTNLL